MEGVIGLIWVVAIVAMIVKSAKKANGNAARPVRPNTPYQPPQNVQSRNPNRPRQLAPAASAGPQYASQTSASAQRAIRESNQDRYGAATTVGSSFGQVKATRIGESGVLLEDRKNDWLAKQLREEAAIYRRGIGFDLGAAHNVNCDAEDLKMGHVRVHNSNGLDRRTFR